MPTRRSRLMRPLARVSARRARVALAGLATTLLVAVGGVLVGAPAVAQGEPTTPEESGESSGPPIGPATAGEAICTVNDPDLDEITGMVASGDVIYAVEGGATTQPFAVEIWTINATTCAASSETYGFSPIDPQDLALGTDGALWVADVGFGTFSSRERATIERVDLQSGAEAVPYRALYPSSGAFQATAVLLDENNVPIIIGNSGQTALLYRPDGPLTPGASDGLPTLQQVGQFAPVNTDTATPRGPIGRLVVTGAAMSPDRSKVVLRTEADAYEFTVTDGDIVAAITQGTPTITPLPNEENGQAITYSADGSRFLTLSATPNPVLRAYTPYTPPPPSSGDSGSGGDGGGGGGGITFRDITTIALITGFLGLAAVVVGVVGIVHARRQYYQAHPDARRPRGPRGPRERDDRRERRGPGRRDYEDDDGEEFGATRPTWPPRPREDEGPDWPKEGVLPRPGRVREPIGADDDEYGVVPTARPHAGSGYGGSTHGSGGAASGGGRVYGGTTYGSSGTTYGSGSGGTTYGSSGTTYGSGGATYGSGSGGTTYGSGGTTYGSGGSTYGSSGRSGGSGGGVYGRPRSDRDDDDPRRPYGRDNIDV